MIPLGFKRASGPCQCDFELSVVILGYVTSRFSESGKYDSSDEGVRYVVDVAADSSPLYLLTHQLPRHKPQARLLHSTVWTPSPLFDLHVS